MRLESVHRLMVQTLICRADKCFDSIDTMENEELIERDIAEEFETNLNLLLTHLQKKE